MQVRSRSEITHHERVDDEVIVLEGIESRSGVDSVLVVLAQLHYRHHRPQSTENQVVKYLHFRKRSSRERNREERRETEEFSGK